MSISRAQGQAGSISSTSLAYANPVAAGSLLTLSLRVGATGLSLGVTDTLNGSPWTLGYTQEQTTDHTLGVYYFVNSAAGSAPTVNITGSAGTCRLLIEEWLGVATSSPLRGTPVSAQGAAPLSSGNEAGVVAGDLCYGSATNDNGVTGTWAPGGTAPGGAWATSLEFNDSGTPVYSQFAIAASNGTFASFPTAIGTFSNCTSGLIAFQPVPVAPTGPQVLVPMSVSGALRS